MYISIDQLAASLERLKSVHPFFGMSFLAFKKARLPVGRTTQVIFSQIAAELLMKHYRVSEAYDRFYSPYQSSKGSRGGYWVAPRYPSTSLQRITADTFGEVFIHPRASSAWGWKPDYMNGLLSYLEENGGLLPAFDIAVWLFRDKDIGDDTPEALRERFFNEYYLDDERILFDNRPITKTSNWTLETRITEVMLLSLIGRPEGENARNGREEEAEEKELAAREHKGAALWLLELQHVGPSKQIQYQPATRLNLLVGDNALGKTFLLDCAFWALTGEWADSRMPALPQPDVENSVPRIIFHVATKSDPSMPRAAEYDPRTEEQWIRPNTYKPAVPGVVLYARHDGSFAVWDSAKPSRGLRTLLLTSDHVFHGGIGQDHREIAGFLYDSILWRSSNRLPTAKLGLEACIEALSPNPKKPLRFGAPISLPNFSRDIPTLELPYGPVPIVHASAGIRRMLAIAYMLVWSWQQHEKSSATNQAEPSRRIILLCDEIEAHLHPRWQRRIIPALLDALKGVITDAEPQLHIATHSPLVMASAESQFNADTDRLHHLYLTEEEADIDLEVLEFQKLGRIDLWLTSLFDLGAPRSLEGELAIAAANTIQTLRMPVNNEDVRKIHEGLLRVLGPRDDYWVRWLSFARKHGVDT